MPIRRVSILRLFALLTGWLAAPLPLDAAALERVTLQLKYYHQFQFAGYYAADAQGFYRDEGIAVTIREFNSTLDLTGDLIAGRCDFATGNSIPFKEWSEGQDLFLLALIFQRNPYVILVKADSPYHSLRDLVPLPKAGLIGPVPPMESELRLGLKLIGEDPETFFPRTKQPEDFARFYRGEITVYPGYATNEPFRLRRQGIETRALDLLSRKTIFPGDSLLCSGDTWRHRPELAEAFRRASLRGWEYALSHTQEVISHILAERPSAGQSHDRRHLEEEAATTIDFIDPDRFPIGEIKVERLQTIAALMRDAGMPASVPLDHLYQPLSPTGNRLIYLGMALALAAVGFVILALVARRQRNSLSETTTHYHNLVNSADGYVAFRLRIEADGQPYAEMASSSIKDLLGHPLEYYQGNIERFFEQLPEDDRRAFKEALKTASEHERPLRFRFRFKHPRSETQRHLMVHATPMRTPRGLFFDGIYLDITAEATAEADREHLQQQLELAQRKESLGLLASGVAHDFNNILSAIRGNAELIAPLVPQSSKHRLLRLFQAVDRAAGLVRQILAYSGRGTVENRPLDIGEEIAQINALVNHALPKQVGTTVTIEPGLPAVLFDPAQFQQVLVNLILNAAESYEGRLGTVTVLADRHDGCVRLRVTDRGCGMSQATISRIFEPYFTTKENGHGLGLAAVQGIIKGVNGTILCESVPGQGTTFTVLLNPCPQLAKKSAPPVHIEIPGPDSGQFVLVADDDELVRDMTVEMLTALGYACKEATGGADCQRMLRATRSQIYTLVIDCRMPDIDGLRIVRELRASNDRIPVVLMSGMINAQHIDTEVLDRRTRFLAKPFSKAQLSATLDSLFGSHRAKRGTDGDSSNTEIMLTDVIRQRQQEDKQNPGDSR